VAYRLEHPLSGTVYTSLGDGRVEVVKGDARGLFDMQGDWVSGDLRIADPEMCRWVGTAGYTIASRHRAVFTETPAHDAPQQLSGHELRSATHDQEVSA
jgi:hypothetical protein